MPHEFEVRPSGDDIIREEKERKQAEIDKWKSKVVVDNPVFKVNICQRHDGEQTSKHKGMRDDPVQKVGYRLSNKKFKYLAERNILATKDIDHLPSTIFMGDNYEDPKEWTADLKKKDLARSVGRTDFNTNIRNDTLSKTNLSRKVFVNPVPQS